MWGGINYQLCLSGKAREHLAVETAFSCRKTYNKCHLHCWVENWPAGNRGKESLGIDRATQVFHEMVCRCHVFRSRMVSLVFEEEFRILVRSDLGRGVLSHPCLLSHVLVVHVHGEGRGVHADLHVGSMDRDSLCPGFLSISPWYASFLPWKLPGRFLSLCRTEPLFLPCRHCL